MKLYTTLEDIRKYGPCEEGWEKLLKHLHKTKADAEPLALVEILKSNGIDDAAWCLRAVSAEHEHVIRLFNCDVAEHVLNEFSDAFPNDPRPADAIRVSRDYVQGKASKVELDAARAAAWDAACAADSDAAAWAAAAHAADSDAAAWAAAARAAASYAAAWAAARAAASDAASDAAAWAAARAAAARAAASDAAAALDVERNWQSELFLAYFGD